METEKNETEQLLCSPEVFADPKKAAELSQKLSELKSALDLAYDEWMNLQE